FPADYEGDLDIAQGEITGRDQYGLFMLQPGSVEILLMAAAARNFFGKEHRVTGEIYEGFSGAPVEVEGKIVGLVGQARGKPSDPTSYMIPVSTFPSGIPRETWDQVGKELLIFEQITDATAQQKDVWTAIKDLYQRLPEAEQYNDKDLFQLIRDH